MSTYLPYPDGSTTVLYATYNHGFEDTTLDKNVEYFISECQREITGLSQCEKWMDGNGVAVLENPIAYIGVSEHFGSIAVWVCPKDPSDIRAHEWDLTIKDNLEETVRMSFGGIYTLEEMLESMPMPEYSERLNECSEKRMTVAELRQTLMYLDGNMEVRIATSPKEPQQYAIGGTASPFTRLMWKHPATGKYERVLFLACGDCTGRLPDSASAQLGWVTRNTSFKEIQGLEN